MRIIRTNAFKKDFKELPKAIQEKYEKKIKVFMDNIKHPSLRVKKMEGHKNRWKASIDMFYRFTFEKGTINTSFIERLNATFRSRLVALVRKG